MGQLDSPQQSTEPRLSGLPENLSRICCRVRKIPQKACDGTCGDCKKHINNYINSDTEIRTLLTQISRGQPIGFGPDDEIIPDREECKKILRVRVERWIEAKKQIIQRQEEIARRNQAIELAVETRMRTLRILALMPMDLVDNIAGIQH